MGIHLGGTHSLWGWSHWDSAIPWGSGSRRLGGAVHDSSQPTLSANRAWPDPSTLHGAHATADVDMRPHRGHAHPARRPIKRGGAVVFRGLCLVADFALEADRGLFFVCVGMVLAACVFHVVWQSVGLDGWPRPFLLRMGHGLSARWFRFWSGRCESRRPLRPAIADDAWSGILFMSMGGPEYSRRKSNGGDA